MPEYLRLEHLFRSEPSLAPDGGPGPVVLDVLLRPQVQVPFQWPPSVVLGITYGFLHVVGPDHLGTLVSFSAAAKPRRAFALGASWSVGHCAGLIIVASFIMLVQQQVQLNVEAWEHVGDYVIGLSMLLCGVYFLWQENRYVQEDADGSISLKLCDCGAHNSAEEPTISRRRSAKLCASYSAKRCDDSSCKDLDCRDESCFVVPVRSPRGKRLQLSHSAEEKYLADQLSNFSGIMVGVLQGLCCPVGVVGVTVVTSLPPAGIGIFIVVFLVVSALGMGGLACLWALLVQMRLVKGLSQRWMYRASSGCTALLGVLWIVANAAGFLDRLNYTEGRELPLS